MGRTVFLEDSTVQVYCNKALSASSFDVGLVIGQLFGKDYAIWLSPTPNDSDSTIKEGKQEVDVQGHSWQTIDDSIISEHSRQVLRMLPGGIDIIGLFVFCPSENLKSHAGQIQQLISSIYSVQTSNKSFASIQKISERIFLHGCTTTKKISCKSYEFGKSVSSKPADFKNQKFLSNFVSLESSFQIDELIIFEDGGKSIFNIINATASRLIDNISNSIVICDGKLVSSEDETTLDKFKKTSKLQLQLLVKQNEIVQSSNYSTSGVGKLSGTVTGFSFVHNRESIGTAIQAMKHDLAFSLRTRIDILNESQSTEGNSNLLNTPSPLSTDALWMLPKRIIIPLCEGISVSDYAFKEETQEDIKSRCSSLIGIEPSSTDSIEKFPPEDIKVLEQFQTPSVKKQMKEKKPEMESKNSPKQPVQVQNSNNNLFIVLAVVMLLLALLLAFFRQ